MSVAFASLGVSLFKRENGFYLLAYICPLGLPALQAKHGSDFGITNRKKWLLPSGVKLSPPFGNLLRRREKPWGGILSAE